MGGRARAWAHGAIEVRLDTTSCNSYTCSPHQGLKDYRSDSPTGTRRLPKVGKSGLSTSLGPGLDGVPQIGVLDFEPGRYVGLREVGLIQGCVTPVRTRWAKVWPKKRILPQAAGKRVRATLAPSPGSTAGTTTSRFSSCTARTVTMRAEHT